MNGNKMLVVDDEDIVRSYIKKVVMQEKLPISEISETNNGLDAVRMARKLKPHIIFMDIRIPDINGIQAAEQILADNPKANVVIISAYGDYENVRAAFRVGVNDFLLKPIRPTDIASSVRRIAVSEEEENNPVNNGKKPEMIEFIKEYIKNNCDKPLYLNDMAKVVFVSPSHLSRTFKKATGQSIVCFIHEQRVARAKKLLLNTKLSITEIAERVGFNDSAYFAACYKNKTGMSPSQCRKSHNTQKY